MQACIAGQSTALSTLFYNIQACIAGQSIILSMLLQACIAVQSSNKWLLVNLQVIIVVFPCVCVCLSVTT